MVDCSTLKIIPKETANTIFENYQFQNLLTRKLLQQALYSNTSSFQNFIDVPWSADLPLRPFHLY